MGETSIEWCDYTMNPWHGCARVSPGCEHCYAETFSRRLGRNLWGPKADRLMQSDKYWAEPLKWNERARRDAVRRRVFCASMADVFEDRPDLEEPRRRLWALIQETPNLDWLLLTKRPQNIDRLVPWYSTGEIAVSLEAADGEDDPPWPNVWIGTTVEDQKRAAERIPYLLAARAAVRFVSCEPLLERVDLVKAVGDPPDWAWDRAALLHGDDETQPEEFVAECDLEGDSINYGNELVPNPEYREWRMRRRYRAQLETLRGVLHWIIIGGESGHGARVFGLEWAEDLVRQARAIDACPFVKQLGAVPMKAIRSPSTGRVQELVKLRTRDRKGGAIDDFPEDLRVREFPR